MTVSSEQALSILRDPSQFQWYLIPLLLVIIYIYHNEARLKNWSSIFAGLALWGCDWFNEIWNALVFHFTEFAPVWGAPAKTAYLILIGLNIEICMMFSIMGVACTIMLPEDRKLKILGVSNRWFFLVLFTTLAVIVEMILNALGALTWDYPWWSTRFPWLIWIAGYFYFFLVAFWVYDMKTIRAKAITVATILGIDLACLIVFMGVLKWI
ncbi:MAG: hypothetical protein ABFD70_11010 [Syntrophaceae bacterium]|nr:hypothetical protein [Deltaproteobacteria bacterium]